MKKSSRICFWLCVPALFLLMVILLYEGIESISPIIDERHKSNVQSLNERLDSLEDQIETLDKQIKDAKFEKFSAQALLTSEIKSSKPIDNINRTVLSHSSNHTAQCSWRYISPSNTTFNIRQLYDKLPFDNPKGGVWTQGFKIQYNISQWTQEDKLKIIIMPHSHCDPGWINTYELYFEHRVRRILDTIVEMLNKNKNYRFIWSEMSFLSLWWNNATEDNRRLLKNVIHNKQFEIVTGGWVMSDEANTHYYSMLDQLIEGHQFIENCLGNITIQSSWANDPFGYSPTMAYLLQGSGIRYMAIQRVHYHIKKALAKERNLEFVWQQTWDRINSTRIFTHILPFFGYDIPHSCGPDPKICCQFDFKRGTDPHSTCSWGINPVPITEKNVQEKAQLLLDQFRKKAQLYRTNILFIPLGDDIRYVHKLETERQFGNFDKLMKYINERSDWNTDIQYGTLSDYFEQVQEEKPIETFPTYAGDFFTYADHADQYWSGYYTSRAFMKGMDRIVQSYLRSAEILFSLAYVQDLAETVTNSFPKDELCSALIRARQQHSIFQHHDGITGTAREFVVADYGRKLLDAIIISEMIMYNAASYLLFPSAYAVPRRFLLLNQAFPTYHSLPIKRPILFQNEDHQGRIIYLFNPTDQRRIEVVEVVVDTYRVHVTSNNMSIKACQISPKWFTKRANNITRDQFKLLIRADIEPYSFKEYTIHANTNEISCPLATIEYVNKINIPKSQTQPFDVKLIDTTTIEIENHIFVIAFSKTGATVNIKHKESDKKLRFRTSIIRYGTSKKSDGHSGAYLFIPDGTAGFVPTRDDDLVRVERGPLINRVTLIHELYSLQYTLTNTNASNDDALEVSALTHLTMNKDTELALRFSTSIQNLNEFYTDLNGFQMIRRKTYDKIPVQGNVYPMSTMAYIEDDSMRLTIMAGQPSGVTRLKTGAVDIFLDRRLLHDDGRGLGEGIMDNHETISTFKLLFELRHTPADPVSLTGYPTLRAHHLSMELLYPLHIFQWLLSEPKLHQLNLFPKTSLFPGDYHLVNLRTLNTNYDNHTCSLSKDIALILRRFAYDCDAIYDESFHFDQPIFGHFFQANQIELVKQTSLSLRHLKKNFHATSEIDISSAELATYIIRLH